MKKYRDRRGICHCTGAAAILHLHVAGGDATRKTESSDSITQAMENAAAKMTEDEEVYTGNEEFRTAFVQNLMLQLDSASDVKVKILMSDYQKRTDTGRGHTAL